jgi:hypothetical protein
MSSPWSGRTRALTAALAWVAALGAATVVGMTAVNAIGSGIVGAGQEPLSQSEVDARLSAIPTTTSTSTPSSTPTTTTTTTTTAAAEPTVVNSRGGSVIARCDGDLVQIMSTTPAQGFQTRAESGHDHPSIRFTSGRARVEIRLRCVGGIPRPDIRNG